MRFDNLSGLIGEDVLFSPKREGDDSFELRVVGFGRNDDGEVILWGWDENHELTNAPVLDNILTCVTEEEETNA